MEKTTKKQPFLYKIIKSTVAFFYSRRSFSGMENLPDEPALIIGNHVQMHGPLTAEIYFPKRKRIWCIGEMMKIKDVPAYAFQDFWSQKPKRIRWFYKIASYIIAPIASYIFTHADTIGIYKDTRIINTFKETVAELSNGNHIIIFPEHAVKYNDIIYDFQDKFIDVAKLYYKRFKKELLFVPMYNAVTLKTTVLGKPIRYDHTADSAEERRRICHYLMDEITHLAKELPPHKVVPYENLSRRHYPMSK